jgi:hypothetical protein
MRLLTCGGLLLDPEGFPKIAERFPSLSGYTCKSMHKTYALNGTSRKYLHAFSDWGGPSDRNENGSSTWLFFDSSLMTVVHQFITDADSPICLLC